MPNNGDSAVGGNLRPGTVDKDQVCVTFDKATKVARSRTIGCWIREAQRTHPSLPYLPANGSSFRSAWLAWCVSDPNGWHISRLRVIATPTFGGLIRLISDYPINFKCVQSKYCSDDSLCRRFTCGGVVVDRIRTFEERNEIRLWNQRYDWSGRVMVAQNVQRTDWKYCLGCLRVGKHRPMATTAHLILEKRRTQEHEYTEAATPKCSLGSALVRHEKSTFLLQLKSTSLSVIRVGTGASPHVSVTMSKAPLQLQPPPTVANWDIGDRHAAPSLFASFVPPVHFQPLECDKALR